LDYRIWQLNPWGYHLTNIIFHILTALAVYFLFARITMDSKVAFIGSILFVALPVHTEAVAYISGRADPIAAFLALISFLFYIEFLENKKGSSLKGLASFFFLVAAIWSKEIAAVTPFLFLLYEISFKKIKSITFMQRYRYFFLAALTAMCFFIRYLVLLPVVRPMPQPSAGIGHLIITSTTVFASYIRLLFLPLDLHMERASPDTSLPMLFFSALVVIVFIFLIKRAYNKDKIVFFGLGWFCIGMLPILGIFPLNAPMAEHWLYIPSIGFILAMTQLCVSSFKDGVISKPVYRIIAMTILICILAFYSYTTIVKNSDWKDAITLYNQTIKYNPNSARLYYNLANEYRLLEQWDKAESSYKMAVHLMPNYTEAHIDLGNVYCVKGNIKDARKEYETALSYEPDNEAARFNLEHL